MTALAGKSVLVVGGGSAPVGWNNGGACALEYARAGAAVVCADHDIARAEHTVRQILAEGGRSVAVLTDATNHTDVSRAVATTIEFGGGIDVLHNNVGFGGVSGTPDQLGPEQWDREIELNLRTAYLGTRCAVPFMRESGGGVIINISSLLAVRFLRAPNVAYTAAKAAVEAMTRSCAAAYGRDNIRVNCLRVGFSESPLVSDLLDAKGLSEDRKEAEMAKSRAKVPLRGEHSDPFDVAHAAVFLASDRARNISGAILNVDGALDCAPV